METGIVEVVPAAPLQVDDEPVYCMHYTVMVSNKSLDEIVVLYRGTVPYLYHEVAGMTNDDPRKTSFAERFVVPMAHTP